MKRSINERDFALYKLNAANIPVHFGKCKTIDYGAAGQRMRQIVEVSTLEKRLPKNIVICGTTLPAIELFGAFCKEAIFSGIDLHYTQLGDLVSNEDDNRNNAAFLSQRTCAIMSFIDRDVPRYDDQFLSYVNNVMMRRILKDQRTILYVSCAEQQELIDRVSRWYSEPLSSAIIGTFTILYV